MSRIPSCYSNHSMGSVTTTKRSNRTQKRITNLSRLPPLSETPTPSLFETIAGQCMGREVFSWEDIIDEDNDTSENIERESSSPTKTKIMNRNSFQSRDPLITFSPNTTSKYALFNHLTDIKNSILPYEESDSMPIEPAPHQDLKKPKSSLRYLW